MSDRDLPPDDLHARARLTVDAANRRDFDALAADTAPDAVYDTTPSGFGIYEGLDAIREFIEGYWQTFEDLRFELEEFADLGNGVTLAVIRHDARPVGSSSYVQAREAQVGELTAGKLVRVTVYIDIEEGRAAAERLAATRAQA
jgi:ketosteroid isomerase-like protein